MAESIAIFAMTYYVFCAMNSLVYIGILNQASFSAIMNRIANVLKLEEY